VRQLIGRVVGKLREWGDASGYFRTPEDSQTFSDELTSILLNQRMAFNSPVWFNLGVAGTPQQASACFILSVDDKMSSILNWYREEGVIFKGGSGSGVNLSKIRSSVELLEGDPPNGVDHALVAFEGVAHGCDRGSPGRPPRSPSGPRFRRTM